MKPRIRDGIHTIPVPHGWTPERAYQRIIGDRPIPWEQAGSSYWARIQVKDGRFVRVVEEGTGEGVQDA